MTYHNEFSTRSRIQALSSQRSVLSLQNDLCSSEASVTSRSPFHPQRSIRSVNAQKIITVNMNQNTKVVGDSGMDELTLPITSMFSERPTCISYVWFLCSSLKFIIISSLHMSKARSLIMFGTLMFSAIKTFECEIDL